MKKQNIQNNLFYIFGVQSKTNTLCLVEPQPPQHPNNIAKCIFGFSQAD